MRTALVPLLVALAPGLPACLEVRSLPTERVAAPTLSPLVVSVSGSLPDAIVELRGPDGSVLVSRPCGLVDAEASAGCGSISGWFVGPGDYAVRLRYVAIDGIAEEAEGSFTAHGDEVRVELRGYVDDDRSIDELHPDVARAPADGVELVEVPFGPEQEPALVLVNGSGTPIEIEAQDGHALGGWVALGDDGRWLPTRRALAGGCGTGVGPLTLGPGESIPAGEIYAIGGTSPLGPGRYLYTLWYEDAETSGVLSTVRIVTHELTVPGTPEPAPSYAPDDTDDGWDDPWSRVPVLERPGVDRLDGVLGGTSDADAPLVRDGELITGTFSAAAPTRVFRVDAADGDSVYVRLFVRGSYACALYGRAGHGGGSCGSLHRAWPAWSTADMDHTTYDDGAFLEIGCRDHCGDGVTEL